jgi:hypothetical protein
MAAQAAAGGWMSCLLSWQFPAIAIRINFADGNWEACFGPVHKEASLIPLSCTMQKIRELS